MEGQPSTTAHFILAESEKNRHETITFGQASTAPTAGSGIAGTTEGQGRLIIKSSVPGRVLIDEAERGRAPLDLSSLHPGMYRVRVAFDEGGSTLERVSVMALKWRCVAEVARRSFT